MTPRALKQARLLRSGSPRKMPPPKVLAQSRERQGACRHRWKDPVSAPIRRLRQGRPALGRDEEGKHHLHSTAPGHAFPP